jgi:ankyrin repeat protein
MPWYTPAYVAVDAFSLRLLEMLLDAGVGAEEGKVLREVEAGQMEQAQGPVFDPAPYTLLQYAAYRGCLACVEILLRAGADIEAKSRRNPMTAIQIPHNLKLRRWRAIVKTLKAEEWKKKKTTMTTEGASD